MPAITPEIAFRAGVAVDSTVGAVATRTRPAGRGWAGHSANGGMLRLFARLLSVQLVARLLSGISILASVWLFAPAEFVRFGALLAVLTLASAVQFLRYDYTIASAVGPAELRSAIRLTAVVGLVVWLAMAVMATLAVRLDIVGADMAGLFLLALAGRGLCRLLGRIGVRDGEFRLLGQSSLAFSGSQPAVVVLAFLSGANGSVAMAMTDIIGNALASLLLAWHYRASLRVWFRLWEDTPGMIAMARRWASLPLVNLPSTLLAVSFATVPVLVVLNMLEADMAGHFALAFRLLDVPSQILAAAISPIAMNRFTRRNSDQRPYRDPELAFGLVVAVGAVFGGISLAGFMIEPWLAGTGWQGFSTYVPLVALFQGGIAMTLPLLEIAGVQHSQRRLFVLQSLSVLGVGLIALLASDWQIALLGFGILALVQGACLLLPLAGRRVVQVRVAAAVTRQEAHAVAIFPAHARTAALTARLQAGRGLSSPATGTGPAMREQKAA
jgi:hypothetical protein